ncbi:MAG: universal stress protein [Planctomycetaceae bacterium]|nr:universal stress protein [Planctomycetaceae bacterium]
MIQLQRILLPTDFSEFAASATRYACAFAEKFEAELHLLHVLETHVIATPDLAMGMAFPSYVEESRAAATKKLQEALDPSWAAQRKIHRTLGEGSPLVTIVRYAREHDIDLIVLGTHGRTGLSHVLMGSVAENVVRKAPCPVLTVRPEGHQFVMP